MEFEDLVGGERDVRKSGKSIERHIKVLGREEIGLIKVQFLLKFVV